MLFTGRLSISYLFFIEEIIAFVKIIIMLTIPAYIIIDRKEKPISIGNFISFKIYANKTNVIGTPKIYQYINIFVFLDFSLYISYFSSPANRYHLIS